MRRLLNSTLTLCLFVALLSVDSTWVFFFTSRHITRKKESSFKSTFGVPVCFRILQSAVMRRKTTKKEIFFFLPQREIATRLLAVQACRFTFLFVRQSTPWDSSDRGIGRAELCWWRGVSLLCLGYKWEGGRRQDTFQLGNKHRTQRMGEGGKKNTSPSPANFFLLTSPKNTLPWTTLPHLFSSSPFKIWGVIFVEFIWEGQYRGSLWGDAKCASSACMFPLDCHVG